MAGTPLLIIIAADQTKRVFPLVTDKVGIGRGPDNVLTLNDEKLSRHHCVLRLRGDGTFEVEDLKSLNGTRVNGRPIKRKASLQLGDTVSIGNTTMIYEAEDSPLLETEALAAVNLSDATKDTSDGLAAPGTVDGMVEGMKSGVADRSLDKMVGLETEVPGHTTQKGEADPVDPGDHRAMMAVRITGDTRGLSPSDMLARARREVATLRRLLDINKQLAGDLTLSKVLDNIVDAAIELVGAERGFLMLREEEADKDKDKERPETKVAVARNLDRERISHPKERLSHTIIQRVFETGETLLSANAQHDGELAEARSIQNLSIQSVLCVALRLKQRVIGVLYLDHRFQTDAFQKADLELVEAFADQAALAITNARMIRELVEKREQLQESYQQIERLNRELEERFEQQTAELSAVRASLRQRQGLTEDDTELSQAFPDIIGEAPSMIEIYRVLEKVAPAALDVFIHGEPGTGKELIAKALHARSLRADKPLVAINCAALPETLLEAELFGHVKGAFTGADQDKAGLFEQAGGGTLFLDEIGEMSAAMQSKLLRVLQEREIRRLGDKNVRKIDVRLVSASNRDIEEMMEAGTFREDLYYRINQIRIDLPPLRNRREDIPLLVEHFLRRMAKDEEPLKVEKAVLKVMMAYSWPGNVRQLESEMKRMATLAEGDRITKDQLEARMVADASRVPAPVAVSQASLQEQVEELEKRIIERAIKEYKNNKSATAEALGLSRLGLRNKMRRYGLDDG